MTAVYLKNRSPTVALAGLIPEQVWTGSDIDLSHLRVFGCIAYSLIPEQKRSKLDPKSKRYIFVGYSDSTKGYRLTDPQNPRRIIYARNVTFLEHKFLKDMDDNPCVHCKNKNIADHFVDVSSQNSNLNNTIVQNNEIDDNNILNNDAIDCDISLNDNDNSESSQNDINTTILSGADSEYCTRRRGSRDRC
ncbi:Retrovirus-related Pol polyprotein from transposon TNT 1-94 [Papilio machaon]|uniref:Retrovirus-related Pol polyprotein from transposon TNT 1-94 n=1 Tax=Papilio machaon TaxID=76193 RepID=A0A0N1IP17_PAPMA|nr:Retrovirus-related Pol polyprotein from transposon TNT 1-94 [Papilio machaon]